MKLDYKMSAQTWKELLDFLTARGAHLIYFPETDNDGLFKDYKYATIEYKGIFFYMDDITDWDFSVVAYKKMNPYEKQQCRYPVKIHSTDELMEYLERRLDDKVLPKTHSQRLFLNQLYTMHDGHTALWHLENRLAENREKEILGSLERITMVRNTKEYTVLRFHSADGSYFDYETKSRRITG